MATLQDLELRYLAAMVAVAEERSFGRAATRLGFTQSAISQQIAALERAVGAAVFDRPGGPKPVELTPVGALVLEHARGVLERVRLLDDELERLKSGEAGRLVIGTFQSVSVRVLPEILGRLRAERPKVEVRLVEVEDDAMMQRLSEGELDAAFVLVESAAPNIRLVPLCEDPYVLVAPAGSRTGVFPLAALRDVTMVGYPSGTGCQANMERQLSAAGVSPHYVFQSHDNGAVQAMVRAGVGHAVMPALAVDLNDPGVSLHPIEPPLGARRISLGVRTDRTQAPVLDRFIELAKESCSGLVSVG